ncbi:response regulator [Desulfomarina sp.]
MAEIDRLKEQVASLKRQISGQKKTNEILKNRACRSVLHAAGDGVRVFPDSKRSPSQVKNTFLESVSHEVRSSINGVVGMMGLVFETDLSDRQRDYLEMVSSSVERLQGVVNRILDYSKIECGLLELGEEDFNLKEKLDNDLYLSMLEAEGKGLEFSCYIGPNVPTHVNGDPERIVQVLSSLVNNGIKYTEQGQVEVKIEHGGYDRENNLLLKFSVIDSGCGLDERSRALIGGYFNKKVRSSFQPLVVGSGGFGLTIASQLVDIMGGRIGFSSGSDGSVFWFKVPVREVSDLYSMEDRGSRVFENIEEKNTYALKGARLLLAEDEHINRVLLETILNQLDIEVTSVESGEQAVKERFKSKFHAVLMDVQMDKMDGLEATRKIRAFEKEKGEHVPVIALTALAMPGDRERCLQAGMDDYLPKPVDRDQLIDILNKHITRKALVVVSDLERQQVLVRVLVESGWMITIAESRRTAMYEASLSPFDLIIFDISGSVSDWFSAVNIIRQLEEYSGRKAVVIGISRESDFEENREHGFDSFITGPFTEDRIKKELEQFKRD